MGGSSTQEQRDSDIFAAVGSLLIQDRTELRLFAQHGELPRTAPLSRIMRAGLIVFGEAGYRLATGVTTWHVTRSHSPAQRHNTLLIEGG